MSHTIFETDVGLIFKKNLGISDTHIWYGDDKYDINTISKIRFGPYLYSVNGIGKTEYFIFFGDNTKLTKVHLYREKIYKKFIPYLWDNVGLRIMSICLGLLAKENTIEFIGQNRIYSFIQQ